MRLSRWGICLLVSYLFVSLPCGLEAEVGFDKLHLQRENDGQFDRPSRHDQRFMGRGRFGRVHEFGSRFEHFREPRSVDSGFVIIDGRAIESPYLFDWEDDVPTLNGHALPDIRSGGLPLPISLVDNGIIWVSEEKVDCFTQTSDEGMAILSALANIDRETTVNDVDQWLPPSELRTQILDLQTTQSIALRAEKLLNALSQIEAENRHRVEAVHRIDTFGYPLTMIGMILTVVAFGHLLSSKPSSGVDNSESDAARQAKSIVIRSIAFVVMLSALDLVWTILAFQAGQMKELNPIASQIISDSSQLICFKVVATAIGTGLILWLRQYKQAQLASWWMCLVCTVLTFRWLTFHSMMAG